MSSLFTLEDVNSTVLNYGASGFFHEINTSKISHGAFSSVEYDFITISHSISSGTHTFEVVCDNKYWTGDYYVIINGAYSSTDYTYASATNKLTITTTYSSIKIGFYICPLYSTFTARNCKVKFDVYQDFVSELNKANIIKIGFDNGANVLSEGSTVNLYDLNGTQVGAFSVEKESNDWYLQTSSTSPLLNGTYYALLTGANNFKLYFHFSKTTITPTVTINGDLMLGTVNQLEFDVNNAFYTVQYPDKVINGTVEYMGKTTPIYLSGNDYYCEIDLTNIYDLENVNLKFNFKQTMYCNEHVLTKSVDCTYPTILTFNDLKTELETDTPSIFKLGADIELTSDINVTNALILDGDDYQIKSNGYEIILNDTAEITNVNFINRLPANVQSCFIQKTGSNLTLTNCTFKNYLNSKHDQLGTVIYCDNTLEGLSTSDDFKTNIVGCKFYNCMSSIFHCGELLVDNCQIRIDTLQNYTINNNNPYFLYMTDGEAVLRNSDFDFDLYMASTYFNKNVGFNQCVVKCGETAIINGAHYIDLKEDNNLSFFEEYNNRSHVLVNYKYPQINARVFSSPLLGCEDRAICYGVSGDDWIYKTNIQVTRESWDTQNENHKIPIWEI